MLRYLSYLMFSLIVATNCFAIPAEYYVSIQPDRVTAHYYNLETTAQTTTILPYKFANAFCIPTFDVVCGVTDAKFESGGEKMTLTISVVRQNGSLLREFDDVIPSSIIHDPEEPIIYFLVGVVEKDVSTVKVLVSYHYYDDIVKSVQFNPIRYMVSKNYLEYNLANNHIYFGGDDGNVYRVDSSDIENTLESVTGEGVNFTTNGYYSAVLEGRDIVIYEKGSIYDEISGEDTGLTTGSLNCRTYWYDNQYLIVDIDEYFYFYEIKSKKFKEVAQMPNGLVYSRRYEAFFYESKNSLAIIPGVNIIK